jgi:hypothetical protein
VRIRAWADGQPEPPTWDFTATDATPALQAAGGVDLRAYLSSRATNAPRHRPLRRPQGDRSGGPIPNADANALANAGAGTNADFQPARDANANNFRFGPRRLRPRHLRQPRQPMPSLSVRPTSPGATRTRTRPRQPSSTAFPGPFLPPAILPTRVAPPPTSRTATDPAGGQFKNRTDPAIGNHEYEIPGATSYWNYWGSAAGTQGQGWVRLRPWYVAHLRAQRELRQGGVKLRLTPGNVAEVRPGRQPTPMRRGNLAPAAVTPLRTARLTPSDRFGRLCTTTTPTSSSTATRTTTSGLPRWTLPVRRHPAAA